MSIAASGDQAGHNLSARVLSGAHLSIHENLLAGGMDTDADLVVISVHGWHRQIIRARQNS